MASVVVLLTKHPGCAGLRDAMGRTFLHVSIEKKRHHVLRFVRRWCQKPSTSSVLNIQDGDGNTALHLAVIAGERDVARCLIGNRGVHINLQNKEGKTPIYGSRPRKSSVWILLWTDCTSEDTGHANLRKCSDSQPPARSDRGVQSASNKRGGRIKQDKGVRAYCGYRLRARRDRDVHGGYNHTRGRHRVRTPGDVAAGKSGAAAAPAGTPVLVGSYAFDGFVISNALAFICSTLATFSLVYCGVAAVDIHRRIKLVSFSLAMLLAAARSFCAAFAFSLYLLLAPVEYHTAVVSCVMVSFALLDGLWFLVWSIKDLTVLLSRRVRRTWLKLGTGFVANMVYMLWPYLIIFGYLFVDFLKKKKTLGAGHLLTRTGHY
ncbi:unnamed protein product [Urochloa humidicola]